MALDDLIRGGIALAKDLTADLQATVKHRRYKGQLHTGERDFYPVVLRQAIVDAKQEKVRAADGREVVSRMYVLFLEPVDVTLKDEITLPDGTKPELIALAGFVDKGSGNPYYREIWTA
jgi:hypothetical protein